MGDGSPSPRREPVDARQPDAYAKKPVEGDKTVGNPELADHHPSTEFLRPRFLEHDRHSASRGDSQAGARYMVARPDYPIDVVRHGESSRQTLDQRRGSLSSSRPLAPPALPTQHYPSDDRQFAFTERYIESHRSSTTTLSSGHASRDPSVPPPQRPPTSQLPPPSQYSRSHPPPSPPSSRGTFSSISSSTHPSIDPRRYTPASTSTGSWERRGERLPSPPASRGDLYPAPPRSSHRQSGLPYEMTRTTSQSSHRSGHSASRTAGRISLSPSLGSEGEEDESTIAHDHNRSDADGVPRLRRPKRTRVLMTHVQQHRLGVLWKRSKFPSTQEREEIAGEVGLTPRQVQVWFQNRRQTFRKQIQQNAIPPGSDPADYSDLQKSPRSRRLSLEAANVNTTDDRDRVSQWAAASSSSSSSSFPSRPHTTQRAGVVSPSFPPEPSLVRPPRSAGAALFAHGPPSPPRRHLEPEARTLPAWAHDGPSWRPTTSSSSSSYHPPSTSHTAPTGQPWSRPGMPLDRSSSYRSDQSSRKVVTSPVAYSPPPTADLLQRSQSSIYPHHYDHSRARKRFKGLSHDSDGAIADRERERDTRQDADENLPASPDRIKSSQLPPSLAALTIKRPMDVDYLGMPRGGMVLPSLSSLVDGYRDDIPRPRSTDIPRRVADDTYGGDDGGPSGGRERIERSLSRNTDRTARGSREPPDGETPNRAGSSASLPRFDKLFR